VLNDAHLISDDHLVTNFLLTLQFRGTKSKALAVPVVPDEPAELLVAGSEAASAVSQAVCKSAALLSGKPLYEHISQCRHSQVGFIMNYKYGASVDKLSNFALLYTRS
jgi:hypothetical protein